MSKKHLALYRAGDKKYMDEFLDIMKSKGRSNLEFITFSDNSDIFSLELRNKNDRELKYLVIKEVKKFIKNKLKTFNLNKKYGLYTFLSLYLPDKSLDVYRTKHNGLTITTGASVGINKYFAYINSKGKHIYGATKESAVKKAIAHASLNGFKYITNINYN